jgi:DNA-binding NtrC family response regulator
MNLKLDESVLLVEDTPSLSHVYQTYLKKAGLPVTAVDSAAAAEQAFEKGRNRVALLDLVLPDGDGIEVLKRISALEPDTKVIVITANGSINRAVEAMRHGAFDFLVKPFDEQRLLSAVDNAMQSASRGPAQQAAPEGQEEAGLGDFIGSSETMRSIYSMVRSIGQSTATVFITGESGTGKEVCAQAIHDLSNRRQRPFVPLNCGAIPRDLLESEVFGHLRGSFTGAIADKRGAAKIANGGTLFLDEVCEMDLALQTKLLRFLQTSMIQPVGAAMPEKVDVRIVCATNRDPAEEVRAGRFREDLFYRLHVVPIHLPPLRDRGADVLEIAAAFLRTFGREEGKEFADLAPDVAELFLGYPWPGNVRQLQNVIRNIAVLREGPYVTMEMLPPEMRRADPPVAPTVQPTTGVSDLRAPPSLSDRARALVGETLADVEREFIEATIEECGGSIPRAARLLDVSPSTLYRKRDAWAKRRGA